MSTRALCRILLLLSVIASLAQAESVQVTGGLIEGTLEDSLAPHRQMSPFLTILLLEA